MSFSRRHYEIIAKAMKETLNAEIDNYPISVAGTRIGATRAVAEKLADVFKRDDPRFDAARFLEACGYKVER